jgi:hypothetical protein
MRDFVRFTFRAVSSQPVQTAAGAAMTVCGVSYQAWLTDLLAQPLPWWAASHATQLAVISVGVLFLTYVFWHQAQSEIGNEDRPNIGAVEAYKAILSRSRRAFELVGKRQEMLNIPVRYAEPFLTNEGIIEARLRARLKDELHDALRQGHVKSWATSGSGGPEKPLDALEWDNMEMEFSDDELYAIPWPFGGDRQISAWQRKPDPRGKIHCYVNVKFSRSNLFREFPLRNWPRRIDYVPLLKDRKDAGQGSQEAL